MFANEVSMSVVKRYLKQSGNPYARLSILDEDDLERERLYEMRDPYAAMGIKLSQDEISLSEVTSRTGFTKKEFKIQVRSIFESYSPSFKRGGRLSDQRKDLIEVASNLRADKRLALFQELEKYGLSDLEQHEPMLNRESRDGDDELIEKFQVLIRKFS